MTDRGVKILTLPPRFASLGVTPWNRVKAREKLSGVSYPYFMAISIFRVPSGQLLTGKRKPSHTDIVARGETAQDPKHALKVKWGGMGLLCDYLRIQFVGDVILCIINGALNSRYPVHLFTPFL